MRHNSPQNWSRGGENLLVILGKMWLWRGCCVTNLAQISDMPAPQGSELAQQGEALELVDLQGLDLQDITAEEFLLTYDI